uniref:Inositol-pentakisphosphate 2-kinase n=1 Tax=Pyramimonas obovata TaxID=1411642 RepID=A0A7S0N8B2_9CHLO|mmetsp:Transcript_21531/g.47234  ORF Transcript_21531/g.47234 Transcript_21531/m.47234 type:complete len:437 (+) Transcript_21531:90-1400(+)
MATDSLYGDLMSALQKSCPKDWEYLAEGALNMALRYVGDCPLLAEYILRVRKEAPANQGGIGGDEWSECNLYTERVILPLLGRRYVNKAIEISLPDGFLEQLDVEVWPSRPEKRRKTGQHIDYKAKGNLAVLQYNVTSLPKMSPVLAADPPKFGTTWCVELKPKWGFLPTSKHIEHKCKLTTSRFALQQHYKAKKNPSWKISEYDPLQLFSYNLEEVKCCLHALVRTPQNNLRLFADQVLVFDETNEEAESAKALLDHGYTEGIDSFIHALAEICVREPLFERLKAAQMFDDMDIEAAYPVYQQILARGDSFPKLSSLGAMPHREPPTELPQTREEQMELVLRYMVSATPKDCSVMISLRTSTAEPDEASTNPALPIELTGTGPAGARRTIVRDLPGWEYSIAVVDLDPKPIEKMPIYFKKDQEFAESFELPIVKQ